MLDLYTFIIRHKNYFANRVFNENANRPVILANIWIKPTTYCYRNEKCIFEIYNPICISEQKSSNVA